MSISWTYDSLKTAIQAWMEDDFADFTDQLDNIIGLAESRCLRDLGLETFDATDTDEVTTASTGTVPKASGALVVRNVWVNDVFCEPKSESYVNYFQEVSSEGQPLYWCQTSDSLIALAPIPSTSSWTVRQRINRRPTGLSDTNDTTILSLRAPDLLFAACKAQSEMFDKAPEDAAAAEAEYQALLPAAKAEFALIARKDYP